MGEATKARVPSLALGRKAAGFVLVRVLVLGR